MNAVSSEPARIGRLNADPARRPTLPPPRYRVIVRAQELTLRPWNHHLVCGGPRGNLLRGPKAAGVAVADLELHTVDGQHESVVQFHTQAPSDAQAAQLVSWATRVGHRR